MSLTQAGRALVDEVIPQQVERERRALADLDPEDAVRLAVPLAVVLRTLEPGSTERRLLIARHGVPNGHPAEQTLDGGART